MTILPSRKQEDWRYSDLGALAAVWPQVAGQRQLTVAEGETGRLDEYLTGDDWLNDEVEITLHPRSQFDAVIMQQRGANAVTTQRYRISVGEGARCNMQVLQTGSRYGRIAIDVDLASGANFTLGAVILARGEQNLEIVTHVRHLGVGAHSRQTVRSVLDDRSVGSYLGKVAVARGAQKTDAGQSVKALLLSRAATANAKPELEIFADDVKCAHGATVGELNANALFYLASRGIDPVEARALLTQSFVADGFAGLADDSAREALTNIASTWLQVAA